MERGIRREFEREVARVEAENRERINRMEAENREQQRKTREELARLEREHQDHLARLRREMDAAASRLESDTAQRLEKQRQALEGKMQESRQRIQAELDERNRRLKQMIATQCAQLQEQIRALQERFAEERDAARGYALRCIERTKEILEQALADTEVLYYMQEEAHLLKQQWAGVGDIYENGIYQAAAAQAVQLEFDAHRCRNSAQERSEEWKAWWGRLKRAYGQLQALLEALCTVEVSYGGALKRAEDVRKWHIQAYEALSERLRKDCALYLDEERRQPLDVLQAALVQNIAAFESAIGALRSRTLISAEGWQRTLFVVRAIRAIALESAEWRLVKLTPVDGDQEQITLRLENDISFVDFEINVRCRYENGSHIITILLVPSWNMGYVSPKEAEKLVGGFMQPIRRRLEAAESGFRFRTSAASPFTNEHGQREWVVNVFSIGVAAEAGIMETVDIGIFDDDSAFAGEHGKGRGLP